MGRRYCLDGDEDNMGEEGNPVWFHKCHHGGGNQVLLNGVIIYFGGTITFVFVCFSWRMRIFCFVYHFIFHFHFFGCLMLSLEGFLWLQYFIFLTILSSEIRVSLVSF